MKTKTAYREKIPVAENSMPEIPERVAPSERVAINFETDKAEPSPTVAIVSADEFPDPNEAGEALLRQLNHLRQSEHAQREFVQRAAAQRAAQMAAPEPSLPAEPEARIALWREHGLSDQDAAYLQERPQMVEFPMVTKAAYAATLQSGVERASPAFAETMEGNFAALLNQTQAQARPAATDPAGFFEPPPPSRSPATERPTAASYVSAPVSRREVGGPRELSPRQVKLSPIEQEIARNLGLSDVAYAQGKIRLQRAKANGDLQN